MTDALCGPSNALSSFQKHTQVDRTLQQDRLIGPRQSPSQGFRSFDPRTGSLDADFHAFENASSSPFQLEQPAWRTDHAPFHTAAAPSGWASDFQNLRISNSPGPIHQFRSEAPMTRSAPGDWQQEFVRQRQGLSPIAQQKQPEQAYSPMSAYTPFVGGPVYAPQHLESASIQAPEAQFNEVDFEKAFQSAFDEMQAGTSLLTTEDVTTETIIDTDNSFMENVIHEPSQTKIGSDAIDYLETKDRTIDQDSRDANELAKVAGELIQNVSHETNQKFKNSQFLDLMRRIRDREVEVRNNDLELAQESRAEAQSGKNSVPPEEQTTFQFPDMNNVYQPHTQDLEVEPDFQYPPRNQMSELHPGGPYYPEQSSPRPEYARMSGAVDASTVVEDNSRYALA